jgi:hypothetical protein
MSDELSPADAQIIHRAFERASKHGWGLALGTLCGLGLLLATAILVVRGGPNPGPRLGLLAIYLPGYSVTWPGALLGACYGLVLGYAAGYLVAAVYNGIVDRSAPGPTV